MVGARSCRYRQYFATEPIPKSLGYFQTSKTPGPELLLPDVIRRSAILRVPTVTMPRINGTESAFEATVRDRDLDDKGKVTFVDADCHLLHSG
jgi:hypothetical protein